MTSPLRAIGSSLLLHLLVLGALALLGRNLPAPPRLDHYSFELLAPPPPPVVKLQPPPQPHPAGPPPPRLQPKPQPKPKPAPVAARAPEAPVLPIPQPAPPARGVEDPPQPPEPAAIASEPVTAAAEPAPPPAEVVNIPQLAPEELRAREVSRYTEAHLHLIRDQVSRKVRYPALARRQGWSGQVTVEFTVQLSGEVAALRVTRSSGYPMLDQQALRAVKAAAPFPPPPVVATLTLPVTFQLN